MVDYRCGYWSAFPDCPHVLCNQLGVSRTSFFFPSSLTSATRLCAGVHFIAIISLFAKSHPPPTADPATHVAPSTFKRANFRVIFLKQSLRPVLFSFQLQTSLTEPMTLSKSVSLPRSAYWHHITRQNSVGEIYSLQGKWTRHLPRHCCQLPPGGPRATQVFFVLALLAFLPFPRVSSHWPRREFCDWQWFS